jgi:proline iminopeptidase
MKQLIISIIILITYNILIPHEIYINSFNNITLYPSYKPYKETYLTISSLHTLYYAEFGNPEGIPVLIVHGGPGAGCCPEWSSFFDPTYFHVIMLDQRGAGNSIPIAEMYENNSNYLVEDMEKLRKNLNLDSWILFGGSWGVALSLLYAEKYPNRVRSMVLRGVFLARKTDYEHLFYGMKQYYPEEWDIMVQDFSSTEKKNLINAFDARIMNPDKTIHMPAAHAFMRFDTVCGTLLPDHELVSSQAHDNHSTLTIARSFIHYSAKNFFLTDNQILDNITTIQHIPTIIVQGRYDMICPVATAYELYKHLPLSELWIIPDAGHFSSENSISRALCYAMNKNKKQDI